MMYSLAEWKNYSFDLWVYICDLLRIIIEFTNVNCAIFGVNRDVKAQILGL